MGAALEGIKVVDLTRALAGPYCSMMLGDFGAEIIKVEMPGTGDDTRQWGPPFLNGESAYFMSCNRNKKSITLNLKTSTDKEILWELIKECDVLLENFRPGTMEKLGYSTEKLLEVNPGLIYCRISGFGQTGPYSKRPGFDVILQAMSGIMSITGEENGPPVKVGVAMADIGAGMWAAFGILTALLARNRNGKGQVVDVSLLDGQVAWLTYMAGNYFATGVNPKELGSGHPNIVPYQAFQTKDEKYIIVGVGNDSLWKKFCKVAGLLHIMDDPRYATNPKRLENREDVLRIVQDALMTKTSGEWLKILEKEGIPCGPINTLEDVFSDEHIKYREMVVELEHKKAGKIKVTGIPVKLSETPGEIKTPPPLLGEHNDEVLNRLKKQTLKQAGN